MHEAGEPKSLSHNDTLQFKRPGSGGSLTIQYKDTGILPGSLGHIGVIPGTQLPYLQFEHLFENPTPELAQKLGDRWKDMPWKGDTLVRIGNTDLLQDIKRTFQIGGDIKGRPNFFFRLLAIPYTSIMYLSGKLARFDHYNPYTKTVQVFHPNPAFGMHETGRAKIYDDFKYPGFLAVVGGVPYVRSFLTYRASEKALKQFSTDEERLKALKVYEPKFGSGLMNDIAYTVIPYLAWLPALYLGVYGGLSGLISGHILSRVDWKKPKERFGYVFQGRTSSEPEQVRYAMAKAG